MQAILRKKTVCLITGTPRSTLYLRINQRLFTKPISLGGRMVGWPENEVYEINAYRIAGKTDDQIRELVKKLEENRSKG